MGDRWGAAFVRIGWQASFGLGGSFAPDWVAGITGIRMDGPGSAFVATFEDAACRAVRVPLVTRRGSQHQTPPRGARRSRVLGRAPTLYAPSGVGAMACAGDGGRLRSSCGNAATSASMIACSDTRAVGRRCSSTTGTCRYAPRSICCKA